MPVSEEDSSMALNDGEYPLMAADEKRAIGRFLDAAESQIKEGDRHYLISYRWWKQWEAYVGDDAGNGSSKISNGGMIESRRPSSIDNSDLLCPTKDECDHDNELREALKENCDYILVPEQVWMAYHKWYGGGPAIVRKVINTGSVHEDSLEVEVYPLRLRLISSARGNEVVLRVSKKSSVGEVYHKVCKVFDLSLEHIRIWDYKGRRKNFLLSNARQTLQEAKLQMDHDILLEVKIEGSWPDDAHLQHENGYIRNELALVPVEPSRLGLSIAGGPSGRKSSSTDLIYSQSLSSSFKSFEGGIGFNSENARAGPLGLTGLQNLGNTCFMNSAIQCLAHTPELVEFFLQDYNQEINRQNPLGMEGELAIAFGDLLRKLWAEGRTPIAPRAFKAKLARFAPQFSGYNQHDSQELLAFLLDGLHEDLNRVKLKPYLESKDVDGRPDDEVAHEYWENHKARNDSIIVDICQGQYKSTLVCPFCNKVSVTFDPFMYLSLPLPSTTTRPITVTLFSCNGGSPPTPYTITVPRQARCKEVIQVLAKACQLQNDEKLLLMESYNQRSYRFLDEFLDWISTIRDDANLTAYRLTKGSEKAPLLVFANRRFEEDVVAIQHVRQLKHFGVPLIAILPEEGLHTGAELLGVFESLLRPFKNIEQLPVLNNSEKEHLQNGISSDVHDLEMMDLEDSAQKDDLSIDNVDTERHNANSNGFLEQSAQLFQLFLMEEKNMGRDGLIHVEDCLPPAFNSCKIRSKIHLTVDWSEDALKKYNIKLLEALPEVQKSGLPVKKARQEAVSLYTCLEAFLKEEPLGPEDMWYCPRCKEHRQASKKLDLWRLPEILVVHLKRFSYSRFSKNKLETFVNFPINDLDLTKYIAHKDKQSYRYELYAVSNHYGSMGGGHYTAYAKLIDGKQWYNFDDSHVSPVNEDEIMTAAAYVLFYRRIQTTNGSVSNGCTMLIKP